MASIYHIITDLQCEVYVFGKFILEATPNADSIIELRKGRHILKARSIQHPIVETGMIVEVPDNESEDFINIDLQELYDSALNKQRMEQEELRKNKERIERERILEEERARKAELERKRALAEERARQEQIEKERRQEIQRKEAEKRRRLKKNQQLIKTVDAELDEIKESFEIDSPEIFWGLFDRSFLFSNPLSQDCINYEKRIKIKNFKRFDGLIDRTHDVYFDTYTGKESRSYYISDDPDRYIVNRRDFIWNKNILLTDKAFVNLYRLPKGIIDPNNPIVVAEMVIMTAEKYKRHKLSDPYFDKGIYFTGTYAAPMAISSARRDYKRNPLTEEEKKEAQKLIEIDKQRPDYLYKPKYEYKRVVVNYKGEIVLNNCDGCIIGYTSGYLFQITPYNNSYKYSFYTHRGECLWTMFEQDIFNGLTESKLTNLFNVSKWYIYKGFVYLNYHRKVKIFNLVGDSNIYDDVLKICYDASDGLCILKSDGRINFTQVSSRFSL